MFLVEVDKARKELLRVNFAGHVLPDEIATGYEQFKPLLSKMRPGFCLLTDLTRLERMDLACEPVLDQLMDACNRAGVRRVVRVVPEPNKDIGFGIMSLFHYGPDVRIITCGSLSEAEPYLTSTS
jgi:hypothetical protein